MDAGAALKSARELHAQSRWAEASTAFLAVDQVTPLTVEDLERFAESEQILGRCDEAIRALERSYHAHLHAGEIDGAVTSAFWIWQALMLNCEFARAAGWLARASAMADERGGSREYGWLLVTQAYIHIAATEYDKAVASLVRAAELGHASAETDLVAYAATLRGRALLKAGRLSEGLVHLDDAMLGVTELQTSPRATSLLYCSAIATCHEVQELGRAREWTLALAAWLDALPEISGSYFGNCRIYRSKLMMLRGDWHAAVHELTLACEDLTRGYGQLVIGHAYYELGEMYRLMGDSRAEEFYRRASDNGASTQPGLALLRLSQGQIEAAVNSIRRALAETEAPLDRLALLPAYVHIMIEADHIDAARDGLAELERISKTYDAPAVQAQVSHASGAVRLAEGSPADALPQLRLAARLWRELDAPYETACAAVLIGIACRLLSDDEAASMELDWAKSTFAKLGARPDLDRLAMIIDARSNVHGLSNRDVLRRVAEGKTNRVIASELFVSERTVHRHVSNIFDKLGVNSRTAAAAYAIEHRLVAPGTSQA